MGEGGEGIFFVVSVRDFLGTAGLGVVVCQLLTKIGIGIWVGFVVRTTTPLCQNSNSTSQIGSYSARQQNCRERWFTLEEQGEKGSLGHGSRTAVNGGSSWGNKGEKAL